MCDYSLATVASRPAKVGDKLNTRDFGVGTRGFADASDPLVAVCVLPGTELAFDAEIEYLVRPHLGEYGRLAKALTRMAIFRQVNKENAYTHHDALEFPDGGTTLLTTLVPGQMATVLQLPAAPKTEAEAKEQERLPVQA